MGIASFESEASAAQSGGVAIVTVGKARNIGPLRIKVVSAISTVQPHTYR